MSLDYFMGWKALTMRMLGATDDWFWRPFWASCTSRQKVSLTHSSGYIHAVTRQQWSAVELGHSSWLLWGRVPDRILITAWKVSSGGGAWAVSEQVKSLIGPYFSSWAVLTPSGGTEYSHPWGLAAASLILGAHPSLTPRRQRLGSDLVLFSGSLASC